MLQKYIYRILFTKNAKCLFRTFQTYRKKGPVLCRPTDNVRHIFIRGWDIIKGRHKTGPCMRKTWKESNYWELKTGNDYFP